MQDIPPIDIGTQPEQPSSFAALHRPDPDSDFRHRLGERVSQWRERWRTRRDLAVVASSHRVDPAPGTAHDSIVQTLPGRSRSTDQPTLPRSTSPAVLVSVAVGAALVALGGLWGWQEWSTRSDTPVDDLLPYLVSGEPTSAPPDATDERSGGSGNELAGPDEKTTTEPGGAPPPAIESTGGASSSSPDTIVVHVSGAVRDPGVVEIAAAARVYQALEYAGGATPAADVDRINLAAAMVDGERIHVPAIDEEIPAELVHRPESTLAAGDDAEAAPVDINTAPASVLEELPGIGPSLAQAIVHTRTERGPFLTVEELVDVPGIGESKLAVLAPLVIAS